jgi:probable rRNA maturation factor
MRPRFEACVKVEGGQPPIDPAEARRLLRALARRLLVPHRSVGVLFAGDARLRDLNRRYRAEDRPTDVLSFPAGDERGPSHYSDGLLGSPHLGDIVVSSETTRRQGRRHGHGASREARILLIHGFLHLLGYDHEADDGQMEMLERTLRWEMVRR